MTDIEEQRDELASNFTDIHGPLGSIDVYKIYCSAFDASTAIHAKERGNGVLVPGPKLKEMQNEIARLRKALKHILSQPFGEAMYPGDAQAVYIMTALGKQTTEGQGK